MAVNDRRERTRMLAMAAGIDLTDSEIAAMAELLCGLIDTIDEAAAGFGADAPEPLMRPGSSRWQ